MDKITQANAGHAAENASAADELRVQSLALSDTVGTLENIVTAVRSKRATMISLVTTSEPVKEFDTAICTAESNERRMRGRLTRPVGKSVESTPANVGG
jgi:hypothetical protein